MTMMIVFIKAINRQTAVDTIENILTWRYMVLACAYLGHQ